jgi:peptide/nickel transport system substrate-binding protein
MRTVRLARPKGRFVVAAAVVALCGTAAAYAANVKAAPAAAGGNRVQLAAGTTSAARKDTLIIGQFRPPTGKIGNPYVAASDALVSDGIHELVNEPLFYMNYETGKDEPWLATGFKYSNGYKTLTVTLRKGVRWNDGVPFTSQDIVYTLRQIVSTKPTPWRAGNIQASVASVKALGPYAVRINLKAPNPRFVYTDLSMYVYTSNFTPLPAHIFKGKDFKTFTFYDLKKGWPVGTGPYRLTSVGPSAVTLTRNENWWAAKAGFAKLPAPKQVVYTDPGPEDSVVSGLESNKLDYAGEGVPTVAGYLTAKKANGKLENWNGSLGYVDPCPFSLTINTQQAPWNDAQMRWALNYAINKTQLSRLFNNPGPATPAQTTFPAYPAVNNLFSANPSLLKKYPTTLYSPDKTANILKSKGYKQQGGKWVGPDGSPLSIDISIFSPSILGDTWGTAAQLLQQQLASAGITANMQPGDWNVLGTARTPGKPTFGGQTWFECGSVSDPWATLNRYTLAPGNDNPSNWTNAKYDALVAKMGTLPPSSPQIPVLFKQAMTIFLQQLPVIPLVQRPEPIVVNNTYWKGWPTAKNPYTEPNPWIMNFHQVVLRLQPAGGK